MKSKNKEFKFKIENLLSAFFRTREEEIYKFADNERELLSKKSDDYSKIYIAINNIPNGFTETIEGIKKSIETYIDTLSAIQGNENEKFYKAGFSDAIQLVMECLCKNSEKRKEL